MNKHGEKLNAYLDQFEDESDADPDRVQELTDNCKKAYEAWVTYELEVYQPVYQIRDRIERKIKALCQEAGLETPFTIARELEKLQKQQALDIPWTTSCIEQLLGTEPITYTLVSIRSRQQPISAVTSPLSEADGCMWMPKSTLRPGNTWFLCGSATKAIA